MWRGTLHGAALMLNLGFASMLVVVHGLNMSLGRLSFIKISESTSKLSLHQTQSKAVLGPCFAMSIFDAMRKMCSGSKVQLQGCFRQMHGCNFC